MIKSVIMTSATLAVGKDESFQFFRSRVGLSGGMSVRVGSPFRYDKQAEVILVRAARPLGPAGGVRNGTCPDRSSVSSPTPTATRSSCSPVTTYCDAAAAVLPWLNEKGMLLLSQAGDQNRTQLLESFRPIEAQRPVRHRQFLARRRCAR
jgi:ATP-dependent DNA helicase DinG